MVEDVIYWHELFDLSKSKNNLPEAHAINMVKEEMKELNKALDEQNTIETIDGAIDVMWTCIGLLRNMNINVMGAFSEVFHSNMSKIYMEGNCLPEEIRKIKEEYLNKKNIVLEEITYSNMNGGFIFKNDKGKVLKPSSFVEPDFSKLLM